ncbi:hypothetical protein CEP52_006917 [Fusarium oligoseptatum]|uniref:Histidinol dehydrogenase n=1 Tax=Fusarium oligoseptatum TaxID=2604345 RepID=A0A428TQP1_9HYPO|nr:hypothetical protein CEP52_006917 [Fusarium oligoseptatum]
MAPRHIKKPSAQAVNNAKSTPDVDVPGIVKGVISDIAANGDAAVRSYSQKFDKWTPESFKLSPKQIDDIIATVGPQTVEDIKTVQSNVRRFAQAQRESIRDFEIESEPGVFLGQKNIPIERVGAYIPGGRYPLLASAHMTIVTAKVAGVSHVIGCTPPIAGKIPNATVTAMNLAGCDEIFILGGVQAVAAMALGTETVTKVDFIAGPGNAFVAEAKRQLYGAVGIDIVAGPTETLVVADEYADPLTVATDLVSQAEHGPDTPAVLITTSQSIAEKTLHYVDACLEHLSTKALAAVSWRDHGEVIVVDNLDEAYKVADTFASEHVQILTRQPREALEKMKQYGALFLGEKTCVSYGDKCIGTNHVLPTKKGARYSGGLWVGKYLKTCTYQEVADEKASGELGRLCGRAARAENFEAHARSGDVRAANYLKDTVSWIKTANEKVNA